MGGNHLHLSRRRFAAASLVTLLAGCSGNDTDSGTTTGGNDGDRTTTPVATATEGSTTATPEKTKTADVAVGEAVSGDDLSMVVRRVTRTKKLGEFHEAESGNTFVVVRLAAKNTSGGFVDFNSFLQTRLKDSENTVYDPTLGTTSHPIQSGILAAGEVARGDVVFQVPESAQGLTMQFDFTAFDLFEFKRVTVNLGRKAESVADLDQSLNVEVLSTGEEASHDSVAVTVHDVRTTTELGSFTEAEDGNEYLIPDIEIANGTGESVTVSTALQMRVKTGAGLAYSADIGGSSQLDRGYSESSPIASGDSRRGEIAYQVPTDTTPLYWAFDFLDIGEPYKAFWKLR